MKLTFLYQPVDDLAGSVAFYRDVLGLDESWREGETTVAFSLPGTDVELMLDVPATSGPESKPGGFYLVDSVDEFVAEHRDLNWVGEIVDVPGGRSATLLDPAGNPLYLVDQKD